LIQGNEISKCVLKKDCGDTQIMLPGGDIARCEQISISGADNPVELDTDLTIIVADEPDHNRPTKYKPHITEADGTCEVPFVPLHPYTARLRGQILRRVEPADDRPARVTDNQVHPASVL
jgi:hypothetical protein